MAKNDDLRGGERFGGGGSIGQAYAYKGV